MVLGAVLALGNLWFTAARSTIPLELDARIASKDKYVEKVVGVDDVYMLTMQGGSKLQVDRHVFETATEGDQLRKRPWSSIIDINGREVRLDWSTDFRRMMVVMPVAIVACVFLGIMASWPRRERTIEQ